MQGGAGGKGGPMSFGKSKAKMLTEKNGKNAKNYIRSLLNSTDRLNKTNNLHQSRVMMHGLMKTKLGTMT